ncbi:hypothetical protein SUGI_0500650 [Cryptomeria japonica]|nr:hypothetical protein SUGI_0500650 [Cryptomeria japonica]
MCMSILPHLSMAGSSISLWLVVNTIIRSPPQQNHKPSVKLRKPDRVTLLLLFSSSLSLESLETLSVRHNKRVVKKVRSLPRMPNPAVKFLSSFKVVKIHHNLAFERRIESDCVQCGRMLERNAGPSLPVDSITCIVVERDSLLSLLKSFARLVM